MAVPTKKYKILLCGGKELLLHRVKKMIDGSDIHFQYTSSFDFLLGRALFATPHVVVIDGDALHSDIIGGIRELKRRLPETGVYIVATSVLPQDIVQFVNAGARGFFHFPADFRKFRETINTLLEEWRRTKHLKEFHEYNKETYDFRQIVGQSPVLMHALKIAKTLIENNAKTILITGETGTGKNLLARAIHYNGVNRDKNYVDITCSTLPESLLASELFGHEKGAYTDAGEKKVGLFELAGDGTIFLDEIGDVSLTMQAKLLSVLESRMFRRLGGVRDIPVKACVVVATNSNLEQKVHNGEFRMDLYHRLKMLPIDLPPLRERKDDIPLLVDSFIKMFNATYEKEIIGIVPKALELLMLHSWEGNIRELHHCVERAMLLAHGNWLTERDFEIPTVARDFRETTHERADGDGEMLRLAVPYKGVSLRSVEFEVVNAILDHTGGNKSRAAQMLGISRTRLLRILDGKGAKN